MLKTRVLTGASIGLATLAIVFLTPAWLFRLAVTALLLAACREFRRLSDLRAAGGWLLLALQTLVIAWMWLNWPWVREKAFTLLVAGCLTWLLMLSRLLVFRSGERPDANFRRLGFLSALGAVTFCWFALGWLRDQPGGVFVIFLLLLIIWASDVGAYFSGRYLGKHKLAPVISPGKTWEGLLGGAALAVAAAFAFRAAVPGLEMPAAALFAMTILTTLSSVGGDLFISMLKRTVGLKDTGRLFPGHGGVLDRYDSLLAGASFFALVFAMVN